MTKQTIEVRAPSGYWLEKIDEVLSRYKVEPTCTLFKETKDTIRRAIALVDVPSVQTLADVFKIMDYCMQILRDNFADRMRVKDSDVLRYPKGSDGKAKDIFFRIRYNEEVEVALPSEAEEDGEE